MEQLQDVQYRTLVVQIAGRTKPYKSSKTNLVLRFLSRATKSSNWAVVCGPEVSAERHSKIKLNFGRDPESWREQQQTSSYGSLLQY